MFKGASAHNAKVTDSALGTIRSLEYAIQHLEDLAEELTHDLAGCRKRLEGSVSQSEAPFEYAAKLAALTVRQSEIEDALDLTKNQAPMQLNSNTETVEPESQNEDWAVEEVAV